jgi:hypothetical protein
LEPAEASIAPFETSIAPALVDPPYKSCSIDPLFFLSLNLSSLHLHTVATSPLAIPHDCISTRYSNMTSTTLVRVVTPMGGCPDANWQHFQAHAQAHVSIQIAIIGGGLAGLATALALARVGHRVTVFEQHVEDAPLPSGGVRIPPNQSKVLFSWGLEEELRKIAVVSRTLRFYTCTS